MKLHIIQWNISFKSNIVFIIDYLKSKLEKNMIINLQEVSMKRNEEIVSQLKPQSHSYSIDKRPVGKNEGKERGLGVGIYVFGGDIKSDNLIERSVFPERTLHAKIQFENDLVSIINFHSLTGAGYKKGKDSNFAAIADYLQENDSQIDFFTCDANRLIAPKNGVFTNNS